MKEDIRIKSIQDVDVSGLEIPMIVVFEHPKDYPDHYVARIFDMDKPTNVVIVKKTLEEIQDDIRKHTNPHAPLTWHHHDIKVDVSVLRTLDIAARIRNLGKCLTCSYRSGRLISSQHKG